MSNPQEVFNMSDEEFLKSPPPIVESDPTETKPVSTTTDDSDEDTTDDDSESNLDDDSTDTKADNDNDAGDSDTTDKTDKTEGDVEDKITKTPEAITDNQYADIGKQIMAEFKANGTTIKVKSVEDAIQLMQMGANYHKKMAGLKPSLKTLKLLENNGLLDDEKLNYLIDLSQKKPEAITQLLKDSGIDPMKVDLDGEERYVPSNRSVNDTEIVLDEVLESISSSPVYNKTLTVLGEEWDVESRSAIAKNPEVIRTINMHMENGIYDQVAKAVAYDKSLGKLVGVSDFEAYQRVGSYMHENNLFVNATGQTNTTKQNQNNTSTAKSNVEDANELQQRLNRKQAASPSRQQKAPTKDSSTYNPLEMSDEDFIKLNKLNL